MLRLKVDKQTRNKSTHGIKVLFLRCSTLGQFLHHLRVRFTQFLRAGLMKVKRLRTLGFVRTAHRGVCVDVWKLGGWFRCKRPTSAGGREGATVSEIFRFVQCRFGTLQLGSRVRLLEGPLLHNSLNELYPRMCAKKNKMLLKSNWGYEEGKSYLMLSFHLASSQSLLGKDQILFIHFERWIPHTEGWFQLQSEWNVAGWTWTGCNLVYNLG